jgi:hypothetical protein
LVEIGMRVGSFKEQKEELPARVGSWGDAGGEALIKSF